MLYLVMECNESNAVIEQVRGEHIIEPPRGAAVADVLRKDENVFWARRRAVWAMGYVLLHACCVGIMVFFNLQVMIFEVIEA